MSRRVAVLNLNSMIQSECNQNKFLSKDDFSLNRKKNAFENFNTGNKWSIFLMDYSFIVNIIIYYINFKSPFMNNIFKLQQNK